MKQYIETVKRILAEGVETSDRTGVGRIRIFGVLQRYNNVKKQFPLLTTKQVFYRGMIEETLWFIAGNTNANMLSDKGVKIWDSWKVKQEDIESLIDKYFCIDNKELTESIRQHYQYAIGDIGPMYGMMWRNAPRQYFNALWPILDVSELPSDKVAKYKKDYESLAEKPVSEDGEEMLLSEYMITSYTSTVDQLNELVLNLKKDPYSARHVVSAWIPEFVPCNDMSPQHNVLLGKAALAACHAMFQCFVLPPKEEGGKLRLSLMLTVRSNDFLVGNPYNVAQYALLLCMLAHVTDMEACDLVVSIGDTHIYKNHLEKYNPDLKEGVETQITRIPLILPSLWLNPEVKDLFAFTMDDICIKNYTSHPKINYPVAM